MKKRKPRFLSVCILFFLIFAAFVCFGKQIFVWKLDELVCEINPYYSCAVFNDFSGNPRFILQDVFAQKKQYWMKLPDLKERNSEYQVQAIEAFNQTQLMIWMLSVQNDKPHTYELWLCTPENREARKIYSWPYQEKEQWDIYSCKEGIILAEFSYSFDIDEELSEYQINRTLFPSDNPQSPSLLPPLRMVQSTTVSYSLSADGIFYLDRYGNGYYGGEDGRIQQVFSNNGETVSINNLAFSPTPKGIYFYNLDTGKDYWIEKEGEIREEEIPIFNLVREDGWEIEVVYVDDEATIYAVLEKEENMQFLISEPGKEPKFFQDISLSPSLWVPIAALLSLFSALILFGIGKGVRYLYGHIQIIPITFKVAAAALPVLFIGCLFIQQRGEEIFYEKKLQSGKAVLLNAAVLETAKIDREKFIKKPVDVNYFEERTYQKLMQTWHKIEGLSEKKAAEMQNHLQFGYFWVDGEDAYPIQNMDFVTTPARSVLADKELSMLSTSMQEKISVCGTYSWAGIEYLAAYSPVFAGDKTVCGVVSCSLTTQELVSLAKKEARTLSLWIFQGLFLVTASALLLLYYSLRPLKHLTSFFKNLEENQQQNNLQAKGYDEVSELIGIFNRMAENIQDYMDKVKKLQKQYEPFVPDELVKLLGKEDIRMIEPGDCAQCRGSLGFIKMKSFSRLQAETPADILVEQINQGLQKMIPQVRVSGGQIVKFIQGGMLVLFPEKEEAAVWCMKKLLEDLHETLPAPYYAGMDYGEVKLEVVGNKRRMEISVCTEDWKKSSCLQKLSARYGLGLITAKSLIEQINSRKKMVDDEMSAVRYLGWVYLSAQKEETEVYEWINQEEAENFAQTAQHFSQGVFAFGQRKWQESRECFAEVLRINREDHAAQHYFQLCDKKLCKEMEEDIYFDRIDAEKR